MKQQGKTFFFEQSPECTYQAFTGNLIILVDNPKSPQVSHIVAGLLCLGLLSPISAHAGFFTDFTAKLKAAIIQPKEEDVIDEVSISTISLMRPVIVDEEDISGAVIEEQGDGQTLQATTGSLRVSTEEIDFPLDDEIKIYEVKKGDTLSVVAQKFKVSKNTIVWANDLKSERISPGMTLVILPMTGIKHTIKKGDTVTTIARKYKADVDDIAKFNGVTKDTVLAVGEVLLVPEGEIAAPAPTKVSSPSRSYIATAPAGFLVRPLVGGRRTQGVHGHNAVDIAAPQGTSIVASAAGRVITAKVGSYNGGYGNLIIILHDNNIQTVYAHLRDVYVTNGQSVTQGQVIGTVGNTGRSTGPHLHFEVRGSLNPF